jgi:hypothetical protein
LGVHQAFAAPADSPAVQEGVQVLTRGPVHEAFAEVIAFDRQEGVVVAKAPPDAIEELPPDQRPAGANVTWIPGYWAWDDDNEDFLWVSGVWRFLPPGRQWVAGYWGKAEAGYQWTSGYWADGKAREIEYLPQPPEMVNAEPDGDAPSENQVWIPGIQAWNQNRYAVRPGYWGKIQTGWDWIPAHYVGTPRGYVFVDGYWDYSFNRRGVLFAPVMFDAGVYSQAGFTYSPFYAINAAAFFGNLFLRPSYGHYYFGDYYAANYEGMGFYPSYAYHNHQGYDPFYAQQSWQNRQDRDWQQNVETQFRNRREVGSLAGLTPMPYQSGESVNREQGISKAGNRRVRTMAIEIAWGWLRFQPQSQLSLWFQERYGPGNRRSRRVGIVALARKLLIALWRYLEQGVIPDGAILKPA